MTLDPPWCHSMLAINFVRRASFKDTGPVHGHGMFKCNFPHTLGDILIGLEHDHVAPEPGWNHSPFPGLYIASGGRITLKTPGLLIVWLMGCA